MRARGLQGQLADDAGAREGLYGDGVALVAGEQHDVGRGEADDEADVAEARIIAAAQDGDGAGAGLGKRLAPGEVGAGHERARRADAGALQAGADEGRAPGDLVRAHLGVAGVGVVAHDSGIVGVAGALGNAEVGPGQLEPAGLVHGRA